MKKEALKKHLDIIIPTLCLILAVCIIIPLSLEAHRGREISYDYSVEVGADAILPVGYEREGDYLVPKGDDSYLVLPVTDEGINDVRIILKDKIDADCRISLRYVAKNSGQSVDNSVYIEVKRSAEEFYFTLPYNTYTALECYIPTGVEVESVVLSNVLSQKPVKEIKANTTLLICTLAPATLIYIGALACLIIKKRRSN